jgi:hypothetical protein
VLPIGTTLVGSDAGKPVVGQSARGAVGVTDDGRAVAERSGLHPLLPHSQDQHGGRGCRAGRQPESVDRPGESLAELVTEIAVVHAAEQSREQHVDVVA